MGTIRACWENDCEEDLGNTNGLLAFVTDRARKINFHAEHLFSHNTKLESLSHMLMGRILIFIKWRSQLYFKGKLN